MSSILSRIQEIALNEGITIGALERKIGASKGVLSRAISNGTDIQSKWIQVLVENYPQYSTRWILTGRGSILHDANTSEVNKHENSQKDSSIHSYDESILYKMFKEKDAKVEELLKENVRLEERIKQLVSLNKGTEHQLKETEVTEAFIEESSGDYGEGYSSMKLPTTSKSSSAGKA